MLAKITAKNQLTLPKSVTEPLGPVQYFDVQTRGGQIVLTPVRIQRGDALRAKLAELALSQKTLDAALSWAETQMGGVKTIETPQKARAAKKAKTAKPLSAPALKKSAPQKAAVRKTGSSQTGVKSRSTAKTIETPKKAQTLRRAKPLSADSKPAGASTASRQRVAKPSSASATRASKAVAQGAAKALAPATRSRVARGVAASRRVA